MKSKKPMLCMLLAAAMSLPQLGLAASHREAPITALDHKADITDIYAFVSYNDASKVTFLLNVDPLLEPGNGPNYFPFDDKILYAIHVDNNNDALDHVVFEVRFQTEIRLPAVFTGFVGAGTGIPNSTIDLDVVSKEPALLTKRHRPGFFMRVSMAGVGCASQCVMQCIIEAPNGDIL